MIEIAGIQYIYSKKCPFCKKTYGTNSRNQKFCCAECGKKYSTRKKAGQARYQTIAPVERIRVAAHTLATRTMELLCELGLKKRICTCPECDVIDKLETHHYDLNWLNNTPANIDYFCLKHHAQEHSKLIKRLDEEGLIIEEFYPIDFLPLARIINKDKFK